MPPIAYMYRPNLVRPSSTLRTTVSASTIGTTHGTPSSGITPLLRLWLRTSTSARPTAATMASFRMVTLSGGATRPFLRLRWSRKIM